MVIYHTNKTHEIGLKLVINGLSIYVEIWGLIN